MLNKRNLDDQSYQEIVRTAMGRLPWLCPQWTDHNAHDPGVTVLELMAWYKEMQQYQLNQFTGKLEEKLLKLAGVRRRPAAPAACALEAPAGAWPALSRLATPEGILFELTEAIPAERPQIVRLRAGGVELWELLSGGLTFQPFGPQGRETLEIGLGLPEAPAALRLYFQVAPPPPPARNPFRRPDQRPREIRWTLEGSGSVEPLADETHALSQSGFITFPPCPSWPEGEGGLRWLSAALTDPGCEEAVRLEGVSASRWQAVQRETWARSHRFTAPPGPWEAFIADGMARDSAQAVFLRKDGGWVQTADYTASPEPGGLGLALDAAGTVQDGAANVWLVCLDQERLGSLLFDTAGLPGETLLLELGDRQALTEDFSLLCQSLDRDGQVRLLPWRWTEDLYACGPRDRVFAYDGQRQTITFGDGEHGAVLRRGKGAVLVTDLTVSLCGGGNIPAKAGLAFQEDGTAAENDDASGGRDRESVSEAAVRFLRELGTTEKCVTAEDYERMARSTPGLRVGAVKALPGYDPEEPAGRTPALTIVAAPASGEKRPMPDQRFLDEIRRHLEAHRLICTQLRVVAPVYEEIDVSVRLRLEEGLEEVRVREAVEAFLSPDHVGGVLRPGELAARLQALPGVLQVKRLDLRAAGTGCYRDAAGDVHLPRQAIPVLGRLDLGAGS